VFSSITYVDEMAGSPERRRAVDQLHGTSEARSGRSRGRASSRRTSSSSHRHRKKRRRSRSRRGHRSPSRRREPDLVRSASQLALLSSDQLASQMFQTPPASNRLAAYQTPTKSKPHLGSLLIQDWFKNTHQDDFIGDASVHQAVFDRLASLSILHCQVLVDLSESELLQAWSSSVGVHIDLCGPGIARSFLFQLRSSLTASITIGDASTPDPTSPLAGALAHLVEAAGRLRRRKRTYEQDLASSDDESQFDLSRVLDSYRSKIGFLRCIPSSAFGDLRRLFQLKTKADKRVDRSVPYLSHAPIEDWFPCWIGADLDRGKRSSLHKARAKDLGSKGFASFLSNVLTFMLAHLAVGELELPSIVAYISILCKISEERGSSNAMKYHYLIHNHLLDRIRVGERVKLDHYFSSELDPILRKLEIRHPVVSSQKADPPRRSDRPVKLSKAVRAPSKRLICFKHRPHENIRCQDSSCLKSKDHLDTNVADQLARFQRAHQAFERSKKPANQRR
jgi:hypothetical protein